jgi:hypothetical protein
METVSTNVELMLTILSPRRVLQETSHIKGTLTLQMRGHAVAQLVEALRYSRKVAGLIPDGVLKFGSEVDSASNRNEYQEYFLGG